MSLFVLQVDGTYGGQWYAAVHADTLEGAKAKIDARYPVISMDEGRRLPDEVRTAPTVRDLDGCTIVMDDNGVSDLLWVSW